MGKCLFNIPPPPGEKVGEWGDIYISPITPHHEFTRTKTNETMSDLFPNIPTKKGSPIPKKIIRIPLGEQASAALDETGLPAFAICGCERPPGQPGRWIIYLAETQHPAAMQAIELLRTTAEKQTPVS
jgi:hypothetical protein